MGQKLINEIGNKYGHLTVKEIIKDKNNRTAWLCECDCGNSKIVRGSDLRKGKITTCGQKGCPCKSKQSGVFKDETGNKYGHLTVLYRSNNSKDGKIMWHCKCQCDNECDVRGTDLRLGHQQSCGCMRSKGEYYINNWLIQNKFSFEKEYKFNDLLGYNNGQLRFDFAIFNQEKLLCLIEFQGEQHFYPVKTFGGEEEFNKRIYNDNKKREYCIKNNIPLLLLRKTDNLELLLQNFLYNLEE